LWEGRPLASTLESVVIARCKEKEKGVDGQEVTPGTVPHEFENAGGRKRNSI